MIKKYRVHDLGKFNYSDIREYIDEYHTGRPLRNDEIVNLLNTQDERITALKAQLYCENEDGVCFICNNHYLVKGKTYDKYYISKCKKDHDECSTEILRYCKDFELKVKE